VVVSILGEVHPLTFDVLRLLSAREFRSGEALAASLDVSRASVWGALNEAEAAGVAIHRVHGRGYRLAAPLDWLDRERIARAGAECGLTVEIVDSCSSTNASLLERADAGIASGHVLAAELQTGGRGRLGRKWHSGFASSLTFSVLWRFAKGTTSLAGLSLAVGVAIARVLRRQEVEAQLKWPNDVLWRGRKLGGVLIEVRGDALGPCTAVIGIGLNVCLDAAHRRQIDQPAADLVEAGAPLSRSDWLIGALHELADVLRAFDSVGFAQLRSEWGRCSAHHDKPVRLALPDGRSIEGIAKGVDAEGRLLVESAGRRAAYVSAEVSLRASHDPRG
jgi:BirA family transcriptional regulator, biotin operon repressor / biotin---[acetyl-CoA-carboxylase] ligase